MESLPASTEAVNNDTDIPTQSSPGFLPPHFIPYIIFLVVMILMGTFGNILIILSVALDKKLQVVSNVFTVNLAIADLSVTAGTMPFIIVGLFNDAEFYDHNPWVCVLMGALVVLSCACSIWSILTISLERYFHICHRSLYLKLFNRRSIPLIVIFLWCMAMIVTFPYFDFPGSLGTYGYRYRARQCTWIWKGNYFTSYYLIGLGVCVPMTIIPYCYTRIFLYVRKSNRKLSNYRLKSKSPSANSPKRSNVKNIDIQIMKTVLTIWIAFTIMWTPYTFDIVLNFYGTWPSWYLQFGTALGVSNSSINFIIYGIMNKNFRRSYSMIYHQISCGLMGRQHSEDDGTTSTGTNTSIDGGKRDTGRIIPSSNDSGVGSIGAVVVDGEANI